jgi:hypothetical protein
MQCIIQHALHGACVPDSQGEPEKEEEEKQNNGRAQGPATKSDSNAAAHARLSQRTGNAEHELTVCHCHKITSTGAHGLVGLTGSMCLATRLHSTQHYMAPVSSSKNACLYTTTFLMIRRSGRGKAGPRTGPETWERAPWAPGGAPGRALARAPKDLGGGRRRRGRREEEDQDKGSAQGPATMDDSRIPYTPGMPDTVSQSGGLSFRHSPTCFGEHENRCVTQAPSRYGLRPSLTRTAVALQGMRRCTSTWQDPKHCAP